MFTFKIWVYDDSNAAEPEYTLIGDTNSDGTKWHRLTRAGDPKAYDLNEYFPFGLSTALSAYGLRFTTSERERAERERLISNKFDLMRENIIEFFVHRGDADGDEPGSWVKELNTRLTHLGMEEYTLKTVYTAKVYQSRSHAEKYSDTPILTMRIEAECIDDAQDLAQETLDNGTDDLGSNIDLTVDMADVYSYDDAVIEVTDSGEFQLDYEVITSAIEDAVQRMHIVVTPGEPK